MPSGLGPNRVGKPKRLVHRPEGEKAASIGTAAKSETAGQLPPGVMEKIDRMVANTRSFEAGWQECLAFFDHDQYAEVFADGKLDRLQTREGGTKPRHQPRLTRNRLTPLMVSECSMLSARAPVYECTPPNGDAKPVNAARFSEKALLAAYHSRDVKGLAIDTLQYAHIVGAGFTWPYWNAEVGDFVVGEQGEILREGEIGVHVLHQGEVMWQSGMDFYDARYHCVRKAQPVESIVKRKGYVGPSELTPDAMSAPHESRRGDEARDLAYVYHYLERPCDDHPTGRWLQICQGRLIAEPRSYPCSGDTCVLQWIPYIKRRHVDRPMGLGQMLLDIQRTYNRTINQIVAYKNLVLNPQVMAPVGSLRQQLSSEPGAVWQFRPIAGMRPEWREMPDLPVGLFKVLDQCLDDFREIAGQMDLPGGVDSGSGVQAINEREQNRRGVIVHRLADWYQRLGQSFLGLMQEHYTEDRLLTIQGRFGVETIPDFRGAKIKGGGEVRVAAGSIEPRTRAAQQTMIMALVDKGLVDPKKAIYALNAGTAEAIIDSYELDKAKQQREIQTFIAMGKMEAAEAPMVDEIIDDHAVHLEELRMWMKTVDFERQPELVREFARAHAGWHEQIMQGKQMQEAQMMTQSAETMGMENASAPQDAGRSEGRVAPKGSKPMPSQPSMESAARAASGTPRSA